MRKTAYSVSRKENRARPCRESLTKRLGARGRKIRARGHGRCVYCRADQGPLHLDHVVPRSQGGLDTEDNLVLACASCNCRRQDMSLHGYMRYLRAGLGWSAIETTVCLRRVRAQLARAI